jgi:hypothetical protein
MGNNNLLARLCFHSLTDDLAVCISKATLASFRISMTCGAPTWYWLLASKYTLSIVPPVVKNLIFIVLSQFESGFAGILLQSAALFSGTSEIMYRNHIISCFNPKPVSFVWN